MTVLYEDADIIVVEKPAGTATQTKRLGEKDMESIIKTYRAAKGEEPYVGIVHRLDQPVQGVMVFAKNRAAAAKLSKQIAQKSADKFYYAVTEGLPKEEEGVLENFLLKDGKTNTSKIVGEKTPGAKAAKLSYKVLSKNETNALVEVQLFTGRHHQIRVQFAGAGMPLVGDRKYNPGGKAAEGIKGLALCSYKIAFEHPGTGKPMEFKIENPFSLKI